MKAIEFDATIPCIIETFDAIGRENQIEIERSVLQLHEVFSSNDVADLDVIEIKTQVAKSCDDRVSVRFGLGNEDVSILGGVRIAEQKCA